MRDSTHFQTQPQTASEVFGPAKKRTPCIFEKSTHLVMRKPWLTEWLQDPRAYSYHQSELMFELEAIWPLWVPMGERSSFALSSNAAPLCHNTTYSLNRRMVNILLSIWGGRIFTVCYNDLLAWNDHVIDNTQTPRHLFLKESIEQCSPVEAIPIFYSHTVDRTLQWAHEVFVYSSDDANINHDISRQLHGWHPIDSIKLGH